ncbi:PQQ-binding-like beta-propeller repeat protein [Streptomyces sp. LPB2020-019-1HS]|uniref:outer membrane protein assembly factor BamB family protein n=1 Tax=Streptomyces sp. LPB2020-019-1HS TaxID=3409689 RepID=UPI003B66C397
MTQPPPPPENSSDDRPSQPPKPPSAPQTPPTPPQGTGPTPPAPPAGPPQPAPGYGYPQAPQPPAPPAGYGYPQAPQPPAPPAPPAGYGYPQAPQPPQPPAGYGYPGQPAAPNPYAQQPGPYGGSPYSGYGYPGQPGAPSAAPTAPQAGGSGGGSREKKKQLTIIVAAVAAIALIVGGGVWYAASSGGGTKHSATDGKGGESAGSAKEKAPADPSSRILFQHENPTVSDSISTPGSWLTDTVYAKTGVAEVAGYDLDKGTKLWTIKLPGPVCEASTHMTADGRTAILYQPAMPTEDRPTHGCSQIAALDLKAGKKLWTQTVKSGDSVETFDNITVGEDAVAVGSSSGGAAFGIADGKARWLPKPDGDCHDGGYAGGAKLVAVRECGTYDAPVLHIQTVDPKTGKVLSDYTMAEGIEDASVISTDPLVVAADAGGTAKGSAVSDFYAIDNATGKLRTHISVPGDIYAVDCDIFHAENCTNAVVGNDRLYVSTEQHGGSADSDTNEIVAFDLATGKQTGQRADAGDDWEIYPLRMDGPNIIAYKSPPWDKSGQIVSIDGETFQETVLMQNPATREVRDIETSFSPDTAEFRYGQGRLFMGDDYVTKPSSYGKDYLVVAFGTDG